MLYCLTDPLFFSHKPLDRVYVTEPQWKCHGPAPKTSIFSPSLFCRPLIFIFGCSLPRAFPTSTRRPPSPTSIICSAFPFPSLVKMLKKRRGGRPSPLLRESGFGHVFVLSSYASSRQRNSTLSTFPHKHTHLAAQGNTEWDWRLYWIAGS